jgi:hypothetical protein
LSNAFAFLSAGNNRSAIIEAVSGLEVGFRSFVRRPDAAKLSDAARGHANDLARDTERLGFSASLTYLVPIVIRNFEDHSSEHAQTCEAVDTRHNIVHNGQREVHHAAASKHVRAVAAFAETLNDCTVHDAA